MLNSSHFYVLGQQFHWSEESQDISWSGDSVFLLHWAKCSGWGREKAPNLYFMNHPTSHLAAMERSLVSHFE